VDTYNLCMATIRHAEQEYAVERDRRWRATVYRQLSKKRFRIELVRSRTFNDYAEIVVEASSSSHAWDLAHGLTLAEDSVAWTIGDTEETSVVINSVTGE
jgi:hypothetical protein